LEHLARSFAPVSTPDARVLVLGSMPGLRSLQARQYYAHPQNRFWPFMGELVGATPALPYAERCRRLTLAGIALWDVLASCERIGSLDSAIRDDSAQPNDFARFLGRHPGIGTVLFNGAKAEDSFRRFVRPSLARADLEYRRLPSTSPANASQRQADKLAAWRDGLRDAGIDIRATSA
jgi:hypoxanthine-DNA glycosylase